MKQIIIFSVILWAHGASFAALVDTGERQPLRTQAPVSESDIMDWYQERYVSLKTFNDPVDARIFAQFLYNIWRNERLFRQIHTMEAPHIFSFNPSNPTDVFNELRDAYYGFNGIHTLVSNREKFCQRMAKMAVHLIYRKRVGDTKYNTEYARHVGSTEQQ